MTAKKSTLTRKIHKMPVHIREELEKAGVMEAYKARPPYQRNDYVGWIIRAVRTETKAKRMEQMLAELKKGGVYMRMEWSGK